MTSTVLQFTLVCLLAISPLLVHEMGHWAVLKRKGIPVKQVWLGLGPELIRWRRMRIGMLPIGGAVVPEPQAYARATPRDRIQVALAGPLLSLIYGVLLMFAAHASAVPFASLSMLAALNFWLAALNLLPIPPLDGYHALAAWYEHKGDPLSDKVQAFAARLGNGFVFGIGFFVLASVFLG